ncbi:MAG: cell wall metabolism sensor histidine kinase WalK [Bacteroidia bacterium]|nr:cell wall metabolism sensor histidine kinase WalK [Bacteroidia bacterium]MCX7652305.1 cell wall metabolism sensor histidine kinase WalK [Bacteroidia bacterium]MDW8416567.1 ATP-binding protein [Bacteroidia bacterium]
MWWLLAGAGIITALALIWGTYHWRRCNQVHHTLYALFGTKAWENALRTSLHKLRQYEEAAQAQQAFLAEVSHELKTPLNILLGYLDTLTQGAWKDENVALPFLQKALSQVHRMESLVQDILLLAQIESGGWLIQPEATPLYPLLENVWSELEPLARRKNITLRTPSMEVQDLAVEADPFALQKVFKNLLENAIQYSSEGKSITVSWELSPDRKKVKISIRDEGIGIPEEHLPHIFDRFYRVDKSRSRQSGGTGLGLSIVKELIEAHGERISVQSQVSQGSVFTFALPACA